VFGEKVIVHTAHEFKTAHNSMIALMNRIKACELIDYVRGGSGVTSDIDIRDIDGFKTGNQPSITMKNGHILQFAARSSGSGRGFTGDLVVLDEAYALKASEMAALLPTMSAKSIDGNPQVWFTSSAGMPESDLLAGLREQGMSRSADRLAYFEWSAEDDADPLDKDSWYQANPALGYRISEEFIQDEYDTFMAAGADEEFKRERLGIWARLGGESVFPAGVWSNLADEDSRPGAQIVFAVDVSPSRDSASISLLSFRDDGLIHGEIIENRVGTSWVGSRLAELVDRHSPIAVVAIAGSASESLIPKWKREGVRVKLIKFVDYVQACGVFFDWVSQGKLRHLGDDLLAVAIDGAKQSWRSDGASWYWSRKNSDVDITPLVALTVAVAGLEKKSGVSAGRKRRAVVLS
jgi:phage terminase large subunit-like protein